MTSRTDARKSTSTMGSIEGNVLVPTPFAPFPEGLAVESSKLMAVELVIYRVVFITSVFYFSMS